MIESNRAERVGATGKGDDSDSVMVVLNKNEEAVELDLARFAERLQAFTGATDVVTDETRALGKTLELPPRSVQVLELK